MSQWTPEITKTVFEMFNLGHSAGVIVKILNTKHGITVSRNAIIGKLSRAGIKRGSVRSTPPKAFPPGRKPTPRAPKPPKVELPPYGGPVGPVGDFPAPGTCRWVFGDPLVSFQCCGRPVKTGRWCEHHNHEGSTSSEGPKPEFSRGKRVDKPQRLQSACGLQPSLVSRSPKQALRS